MSITVDRCSCFNVTFAVLKKLNDDRDDDKRARSFGALRQIASEEGHPFGENCKMCRPYVKEMLRTGQTLFHEILDDD